MPESSEQTPDAHEPTPEAPEAPTATAEVIVDDGAVEDSASKPARRHRRPLSVVIEWVAIIGLALLVSFLVRTYVVQTFYIPSGSMEPTLLVGDRIIVNKLAVDFGTIHRGDIVVFKAPPTEHCGETVTDLVKRVIGLPGDHLTSRGNTIYVNGKPLNETWTHYEPLGQPIGNVTVPANHYFMMGDNHPDSCDSRMWGTVPRSDLIGKAFLRIWPLSRFGFL